MIHLAFKHDLAFAGGDFAGALAADLRAVEAIGEALAGSGKPFVNTTGTMLLAHSVRGRAGTEDDEGQEGGNPRVASENLSLAFAKRGVRTSIVRLAPTVHSSLDHHGFIPMLVAAARKNGFSAYVGEGSARWPAVHTLDAARLYRLALEAAPAGSRVHAAAEEGVPFRAIAEAIGRGLGVPAKSIPAEKAARGPRRLSRHDRAARQPDVERTHARAPRVEADARGPARGHRGGSLLRVEVGLRVPKLREAREAAPGAVRQTRRGSVDGGLVAARGLDPRRVQGAAVCPGGDVRLGAERARRDGSPRLHPRPARHAVGVLVGRT